MREHSGSVGVQMKRGAATSPASGLAVRRGGGAVKGTLVYGADGGEVWMDEVILRIPAGSTD